MEGRDDTAPWIDRAAGNPVPAAAQPAFWLGFVMGGHRLAVTLAAAERVLPAAAVTPLAEAEDWLLGIFDLHGEILPVIELRVAARPLATTDHFLILRTRRRRLALAIDHPLGVLDSAALPMAAVAATLPDAPLQGVLHDGGRLVLIHDAERFLTDAQARQLEALLDALPAVA